jgi:glutamate dehydrogenase (NAD(P)+)/glutamate dehydrogenase (NADP+)
MPDRKKTDEPAMGKRGASGPGKMETARNASMDEPSLFISEKLYDDLGPKKVVNIYEPKSGLRAVVVVDSTARGPAMGGIRMAPDVTTSEVFRLARGMSLKTAAADLHLGGGKSGIIADPHQAEEIRMRIFRTFARAIRDITEYIPGPDMGTNEETIGYIWDEIGRGACRPRSMGGIPLDEIGATAWGVVEAAEVAAPHVGLKLEGARVAIEGFGNVGRMAAKFFEERGAVIVAASDSKGTACSDAGLSCAELTETKEKTGTVSNTSGASREPLEACLTVDCDILVPCARPDCINEANFEQVKAKLIVQGANVPATFDAEKKLHDRGILSIPCFIANAGGVICGAVEYYGGTEQEVFPTITHKIRRNVEELLWRVKKHKQYPRDAGLEMARQRILTAMKYRL